MKEEYLDPEVLKSRLYNLLKLATEYCQTCERSSEMTREELTDTMLSLLPRIYWEFLDLDAGESWPGEEDFFSSYLDEDYYESIRRHIEAVYGEEDVFLETFEEDMKYSETPISASISEALADIFQPLYDFISIVKDSEGEQMTEAFRHCKEDFASYWSQTLCNVLRALNNIKFS